MCVHSNLGVPFIFAHNLNCIFESLWHQRNQRTSEVGRFSSVSFHSCLFIFDQTEFSVHGATRVWALRHRGFFSGETVGPHIREK